VLYKKNEQNIKENQKKRRIILDKEINKPDENNLRLLNTIKGISPKYADHILNSNKLLIEFAKHMGGGIELLDQPVCRSCESPASWDLPDSKGNQRGYCFNCHVHTTNPITVREYLLTEVAKIPKDKIKVILKMAEKRNEGEVIEDAGKNKIITD